MSEQAYHGLRVVLQAWQIAPVYDTVSVRMAEEGANVTMTISLKDDVAPAGTVTAVFRDEAAHAHWMEKLGGLGFKPEAFETQEPMHAEDEAP